jgi:hypothetical protein
MKRYGYIYLSSIIAIAAVYIYLLIHFFLIMIAFVLFSSVFSFSMFLIRTKIMNPVSESINQNNSIDFYKADKKVTRYEDLSKEPYYEHEHTTHVKAS